MAWQLLSPSSATETREPVRDGNYPSSNHNPEILELGIVANDGNNSKDNSFSVLPEPRDTMDESTKRHIQEQNGQEETSLSSHKYFFRRPRLLQYYEQDTIVDSGGHRSSVDVHEHLVDDTYGDPKVQRDFLNLFVDLLWAGIISNVSENFVSSAFKPDGSWGLAFLEFVVLFLTAFKIWNYLRKFLNNFFNKDYLQSLFITWILVVALYYGIQAPYFLEPAGSKTIIWTCTKILQISMTVTEYADHEVDLSAKFSFIAIELFYSIFIPQIRRQNFVMAIMTLPISGLWIGALRIQWPTQAALLIPALLLEGLIASVMELPAGDWFLKGAPRKALDPDNVVERFQEFFIIILGEGVFTLINSQTAPRVPLAIMSLLIFYVLFLLYFNGDMTKSYVHAIFRNRYTSTAFSTIHVILYGSLLLFDGCIRYLLSLDAAEDAALNDTDPVALETWKNSLRRARFTVSAGLVSVMACITIKPLLNKSLDKPHSMRVSNRYVRLAPRLVVMIVAMCLPIKIDLTITMFLGAILAMLLPLVLWEYVTSMEVGSRLIEPKEADDESI